MIIPNYVHQFEIGHFKNFIYVLLDESTKTAAIVDPQSDLTEPMSLLQSLGYELTMILLTHTHHDHIAGVKPLLTRYPHLPVRVGARDVHRFDKDVTQASGLEIIQDEKPFFLGKLEIRPMLTPGHSAGAVSYYVPLQSGVQVPSFFTGDTIFIRDCGRTDGETGSNEEMFASIQRIKTLPSETIFWVGHHYAKESVTDLATEIESSPPFRVKTVAELAALP